MNQLYSILFFMIATALIGCGPDPSNSDYWHFKKVIESSGATSYIFDGDVKPPLELNSDKNASLTSTADVNAALRKIGLPAINETRPDKGYAENNRAWRGQYLWEDYPQGRLIVSRTTARSKGNFDTYDAIWKITIDRTKSI
ncbi:MAG: hypothetical protein D3919_08620 [Candidatus Electrothrix sp. AW5]|nr:hypothetical protein [Candidatus Electrothrix gigas]